MGKSANNPLSIGLNQLGYEADHSPASSAQGNSLPYMST